MTQEDIERTLVALCGRYTLNVSESVRIIGASLPGNAVCAILPPLGDGVMRLVYDEHKPHALAHSSAMLQEWWESYAEPVAFPDGSVELIPRPIPPLPRGPVDLSMTG